MAAPARAVKFTFYRAASQGLAAEWRAAALMIVPTLCVGMQPVTLRVHGVSAPIAVDAWNAVHPWRHSHVDGLTPRRGNDRVRTVWRVGVCQSHPRHHSRHAAELRRVGRSR
ncbi:hypothetical protein C1891_23055 [Pseudomonas sp. GW456-12-1-14-TSB6]|nr:hypothetical protein C1891_23055 [Pseudomonas sp. GW456-12-1-14-TSB6]